MSQAGETWALRLQVWPKFGRGNPANMQSDRIAHYWQWYFNYLIDDMILCNNQNLQDFQLMNNNLKKTLEYNLLSK